MNARLFICSLIVIAATSISWSGAKIPNDTHKAYLQPVKDSIIYLGILPYAKKRYPGLLTEKLAESVLYAHFRKKGYPICNDSFTKANNDLDPIDFAGIRYASLNKDTVRDAIIEYYIRPCTPYEFCHPKHKAIVLSTDRGYIIRNEELLPGNFVIDSINSPSNNSVNLVVWDYYCGAHFINRVMRIYLKE